MVLATSQKTRLTHSCARDRLLHYTSRRAFCSPHRSNESSGVDEPHTVVLVCERVKNKK